MDIGLSPPEERGDNARPAPASLNAETELLGAILFDNALILKVADFLKPEHFFEDLNGRVFSVMQTLFADSARITPTQLEKFLPAGEIVGGLTVRAYLKRLMDEATNPRNAESYGRLIYKFYQRRRLVEVATQAIEAAHDGPYDQDVVADTFEALNALNMEAAGLKVRSVTAAEGAKEYAERVGRLYRGEETKVMVHSGFTSINDMLGGLRPGDLYVLAGRPGMGKTAMLVSAACRSAGSHIDGVSNAGIIFQMEIPADQLLARCHAMVSKSGREKVSYKSIMDITMTDEEYWTFEDATEKFSKLELILDTSSALSLSQIRTRVLAAKARFLRKGARLRVVWIDYLGFIRSESKYRGQRHLEIGEITAGLKQLAKDEDLCVCLFAQLNRESEKRENHRPRISDLGDSGAIERDADAIILLYREAYYLEMELDDKTMSKEKRDLITDRLEEKRNHIDLIVAKNRSGPTGQIELYCDLACSYVSDRSRKDFYNNENQR